MFVPGDWSPELVHGLGMEDTEQEGGRGSYSTVELPLWTETGA